VELRQVRYFLAVAETLHFGKAAQMLCITEQPLSYQIKKLEQELGYPLFDRTTRSVRLTPAGEAFRASARQSLAALDRGCEIGRKVSKGEQGRLVVDYDASVIHGLFPYCLKGFRRRYPELELELRERSRPNLAESVRDLQDGRTDVAFVLLYGSLPEGVDYKVIQSEPVVVALPKDHRLAQRDRVDFAELQGEDFLTYSENQPEAHAFIEALCRAAGSEPHIVQEAETYLSLLGMVAAGMGVTMATRSFSNLFPDQVAYVPLANPRMTTSLAILWRHGNQAPAIGNLAHMAEMTLASMRKEGTA
jgi:DNA-binding transcriptional LysR family regulator